MLVVRVVQVVVVVVVVRLLRRPCRHRVALRPPVVPAAAGHLLRRSYRHRRVLGQSPGEVLEVVGGKPLLRWSYQHRWHLSHRVRTQRA